MMLTTRRMATTLASATPVLGLAACSDDDVTTTAADDETSQQGDPAETEGRDGSEGEGNTDGGSDGLPALFELSACDMIPAADLEAARLSSEPRPWLSNGQAGDITGNQCGWGSPASAGSRYASVVFDNGDVETNYFEEVITDDEAEVDGRPARRITGFDDLTSPGGSIPACATRVEVEPGVILEVEVSVAVTAVDFGTDDDARLAQACDTLDQLLPIVSAAIPT
jgi:Protein of unknown function (DUF3558)